MSFRGFDLWPYPGGFPDLQRSFRSSLAYRLCLVANGEFDGMLTLRPTWEWDVAAGHAVVTAAGGRITDSKGASLCFGEAREDFLVPEFIAWGDPAAADQ